MSNQNGAGAATATPPSGAKRLVKSKSGLKIVCQHDRECAPWDMAEPHWVPDKEVCLFMKLRIVTHYFVRLLVG